jgi:N-acetylglucosamine kinase-like BadF-type ATPase
VNTILLGADIGGTKTRVLIANGTGHTLGIGEAGPGNHEIVGYEGMARAIRAAVSQALLTAGLKLEDVSAAGLGVAGYDWPAQRQLILDLLAELGFSMPLELVNDTILGILAGSREGWGLAVVAGTRCNCWGWDSTRKRMGHVTGGGWMMGEHAGGTELVQKVIQAIAYEWTRRGPATALSALFVTHTGAPDLEGLLEGLMVGKYHLDPSAAPLVFHAAAGGDPVAEELVRWAGRELGELACAVVRQLGFEQLTFDVVQVGSLWEGSLLLAESMLTVLHACAPGARLVRPTVPPINGAIQLARQVAERAGFPVSFPD